jgi:peptidoglycan/LPS O-acetylase OafA/YrhL
MNLKSDLDITNNHHKRHYDLDWLRVLAVLLLIYFHAAAVFYQSELGYEMFIKRLNIVRFFFGLKPNDINK